MARISTPLMLLEDGRRDWRVDAIVAVYDCREAAISGESCHDLCAACEVVLRDSVMMLERYLEIRAVRIRKRDAFDDVRRGADVHRHRFDPAGSFGRSDEDVGVVMSVRLPGGRRDRIVVQP